MPRKSPRRAFALQAVRVVALMILCGVFVFDTQPCLAQFTSGHALYSGAPSLAGATMGTIGPQSQPSLAGATMGTIGPQGDDAIVVTGVNTPGTVRVNMLANLEALLNLVTNGVMLISLLWGGFVLIAALRGILSQHNGVLRCLASSGFLASFLIGGCELLTALLSALLLRFDYNWGSRDKSVMHFWFACFIIKISLLLPSMVNWLVASARDANLFS